MNRRATAWPTSLPRSSASTSTSRPRSWNSCSRRPDLGPPIPAKIVSGGQTGVDRAALDAALDLGLAVGGWCPKGRRAEDGAVPGRYPLTETASDAYEERTELNVRDSDATLILNRGPLAGGTRFTRELAESLGRPSLVVDLDAAADAAETEARAWLDRERPQVLNVAGPRESKAPGIHERARDFLRSVLAGRAGI